MPQPQDKAATRRFLGIITYLSKFCPNLSEVVRPLRDLTHIKQDFLWAEQHSKAFSQAKELVSKAPCLRYFDVDAPVILQVDASEYGLVYRVQFESINPDLSGFYDATLQDIRTAASQNPEQIILHSLIGMGWPDDKAAVPELARPYWSVRHELAAHDGFLFKQDRVVIPSSLRERLLRKLHAAHRGSKFTLRHARSCVFWPGLNSQITDMCQSCGVCAQHAHQHPREPLQPYPVPTLPWQLFSQDLFELNGLAYLVTVDHYNNDFYEIDILADTEYPTPS